MDDEIRWREHEGERRERFRILGIEPRDPHRGRIRVIGFYELPYFPETVLLEVLIHLAPHQVDFSEWIPYQPPAWCEERGHGLAHFYFDRDGRDLTGSYLTGAPREPYTRAGLLLDGFATPGVLIRDRMHFINDLTPIPDRLLRLIWIEEGMPFAGPYEALGGW